jgi:hypothetical protein
MSSEPAVAVIQKTMGPVLSAGKEPVRLSSPDMVTVKDLSFRSNEAYDYLSTSSDPAIAVVDAIITGSLALSRAQSGLDADMVARKMQETVGHFQIAMHKALDPLEAGSAMHRVNQYLTQQGNALQEVLCRGTRSTEEVNKQIGDFSKNLRTQISETIGSAITPDTGGLGLLMRQIKEDVAALRDTVVATRTAKESSSALIGSSFEESCNEKLAKFCENHGCVLEDLCAVAGVGNSKKGDYRISRHDIKSIVLEMKDRTSSILTMPHCMAELSAAAANRDSAIALLVAEREVLPQETGIFNVYGASDAFILCSAEILELGLKIALAKSRQMASMGRGSEEIDVQKINDQIQQLKVTLTKFNKLRTNCTTLRKTADKVEAISQEIRAEVEDSANALVAAVSGESEDKHAD